MKPVISLQDTQNRGLPVNLRLRVFEEQMHNLIDLEKPGGDNHRATATDIHQPRRGAKTFAVLRPLNPNVVLNRKNPLFLASGHLKGEHRARVGIPNQRLRRRRRNQDERSLETRKRRSWLFDEPRESPRAEKCVFVP